MASFLGKVILITGASSGIGANTTAFHKSYDNTLA